MAVHIAPETSFYKTATGGASARVVAVIHSDGALGTLYEGQLLWLRARYFRSQKEKILARISRILALFAAINERAAISTELVSSYEVRNARTVAIRLRVRIPIQIIPALALAT